MKVDTAFVLYAMNNIFLGMIAFSTMLNDITIFGKALIGVFSTIAILGSPVILDKINKCNCQS